jgi:hypothetical protein
MQESLDIIQPALIVISHISPLVPLLLLAALVLIFLRIPIISNLLSSPYTALRWLLGSTSLFSRTHNWSVVYDAKTKLPIDPAYVTVRNTLGVEVSTMITDLNGRFALILPRGVYIIEAQKTNYAFPAMSLKNAQSDGKYTGLYYGGTIDVTDSERSVAISIPMDPIGEDWNQSEKIRKSVFSYFNRDADTSGVQLLYLLVGALLVGMRYFLYRELFYSYLGLAYIAIAILMLLWNILQPTNYTHSVVVDKNTNSPIPFARITVFTAKYNNQVARKVATLEGQFTCLVPKGKYYVKIEKRDASGVYSLVHTSQPFTVHNGAVGQRFSV